RRRPRHGCVAPRRRDRRHVHFAVPRTADLYDGRSAPYHALHPSAVRRQEHRAYRRPCHQYRRDDLLSRRRRSADRRASQARHHELRQGQHSELRDRAMKPRVMIVEDEQALNLLLRYNLQSEGFDVDIVERGDDAEVRIRENVPDLLILDWMLPGVSGIEICRRLRARPETKQLPILMLTA